MVLLETNNFVLIADTYPIVVGHLMISSKEHYSAAAEFPFDLLQEFLRIKAIATDLALKINNSCIFYEHGKAGSCHATSSNEIHCEHFHLHCLPTSICIHSQIAKQFPGTILKEYGSLFNYYYKYGSYLFFENSSKEMIYYPIHTHKIPPHFLRTLICKELGTDKFSDWQDYTDLTRYLQSRQKLAAVIKKSSYALF